MTRIAVVALAAALVATAVVACGSDPFRCEVDYDCDGTDLCRVSTGECVPLVDVECREDRDCVDAGKACVEFACVDR